MGDIKKTKKKYSKPSHPWRMTRITEENALCKEYGIPFKTELWKMISKLESFKNQTKTLAALTSKQSDTERNNLFQKLQGYGFLKAGESADVILGISLKDLLNKRLQTIVVKNGIAKTMKQSRQMITHRHILVNSKIITSPSYIVKLSDSVEISPKSPFYDASHAERAREKSKRKPYVKPVERGRRR